MRAVAVLPGVAVTTTVLHAQGPAVVRYAESILFRGINVMDQRVTPDPARV